MGLTEINKKMVELMKELPDAIEAHEKTADKYWKKYYEHILHSGFATVGAKEADAKLALAIDGVDEPYQTARLNLKKLEVRKELLIELSKNLRIQK